MNTVLVVDDAKLMRNIIKNTISEDGNYKVFEAEDGREAVKVYKKKKPDIVTMDITMEPQNGLDTAREILEFDEKAKIIMVTALGQEKLLKECIKLGVIDYIVKPFSKKRIISSISKILKK
jgi:two-component system chemotaxis response regulator CheY